MSGTTNENSVKICSKANNQDFFVIAAPKMAEKWKNDKTVPLIDVVQSFDVFTTDSGGVSGEYIRPSRGILQSAFGTYDNEEVVRKIVTEGTEQRL
ncbi:ribosome maturation protein [Spinellus fusiger]|nr:ribosome maturation protein [Spinellus fusiger]